MRLDLYHTINASFILINYTVSNFELCVFIADTLMSNYSVNCRIIIAIRWKSLGQIVWFFKRSRGQNRQLFRLFFTIFIEGDNFHCSGVPWFILHLNGINKDASSCINRIPFQVKKQRKEYLYNVPRDNKTTLENTITGFGSPQNSIPETWTKAFSRAKISIKQPPTPPT